MILDSVEKGMLTNIYGPSVFSQKPTFQELLSWVKIQVGSSSWIMGGDFNLITYLEENKGGRWSLDILQESFRDYIEQSQLVDMETRNGWFT